MVDPQGNSYDRILSNLTDFNLANYFTARLITSNYEEQEFFAEIVYRSPMAGAGPRIIHIRFSRHSSGLDEYKEHLPFCFQLLEHESRAHFSFAHPDGKRAKFFIHAVLQIVAGPGVIVKKTGFKNKVDLDEPLVDLIRVQDPALIPFQGEPIKPSNILGLDYMPYDYWEVFEKADKGPTELNEIKKIDIPLIEIPLPDGKTQYILAPPTPLESSLDLENKPVSIKSEELIAGKRAWVRFFNNGITFVLDLKYQPPIVTVLPDGLYIRDVTTDSHFTLKIPDSGFNEAAGKARFAYCIEYSGIKKTIVHIAKTKEVFIKYETRYREEIADGNWSSATDSIFGESGVKKKVSELFEVYVTEKTSYEDIPNQGEIFTGDKLQIPKFNIQSVEDIQFSIDVIIGFIPVIGDLVDLAELHMGQDKWGKKLTAIERAVMGACLFLPGSSGSAAIKALKKL